MLYVKLFLGLLIMAVLKISQIIIRTLKAAVLVVTSFVVSIAVIFMDHR